MFSAGVRRPTSKPGVRRPISETSLLESETSACPDVDLEFESTDTPTH